MRSLLAAAVLALFVLTVVPQGIVSAGAEISEETVALYNKRCAACHGKDGVATKMGKGSVDLNDKEWQAKADVATIEKNIADGVGKMKGLSSKLSPEEISAIARYVLTLGSDG